MSTKIIPEQTIRTCDRCGVVITGDRESARVKYERNYEWCADNLHYDFCPKCSDDILKLLDAKTP